MMQWATALALLRSLGGRLGPGRRQGKWPQWPEQALGSLGAVCGIAAALHWAPGEVPELFSSKHPWQEARDKLLVFSPHADQCIGNTFPGLHHVPLIVPPSLWQSH